MKIISASVLAVVASGLLGCTEPGETTTVGAATGGVLGAGLGAIIGSQTGSAGGGLVLGALAGSAAGGAVGNVLEGQEKTLRTQDEAIERHERTIQAQRAELEELRRINQETSPLHAAAMSLDLCGAVLPIRRAALEWSFRDVRWLRLVCVAFFLGLQVHFQQHRRRPIPQAHPAPDRRPHFRFGCR